MQVDEYNNFSTLFIRYKQALKRLEDLGVSIPGASRLRKYESRLQQSLNDPRPALESKLVFALAFDLREIDEIIEIVDHLPYSPEVPLLNLLHQLPEGGNEPDQSQSTAPRDAQYELYLGTILRRAGVSVIHGAPDLVATWNGQLYFLEAKRPSSKKRVDDRLRAAVHQMRRLPKPGLIALSLDQVIRPHRTILAAHDLSHVAPKIEQLIVDYELQTAAMWQSRLEGEPVDALLLTARVPARLISTGHLVLGTAIRIEILTRSTEGDDSVSFCKWVAKTYLQPQGIKAH